MKAVALLLPVLLMISLALLVGAIWYEYDAPIRHEYDASTGLVWHVLPTKILDRAAESLGDRMNRCTLGPLDAKGLADFRQWEESHGYKPMPPPVRDWAGYADCLGAAARIWKAVLVALLVVFAAAAGMASRSRLVKDGFSALKRHAPSILRLLWWPALGAGLFFSLAATWIEWHMSLGQETGRSYPEYYGAYSYHLALAVLFAAIFTGLLAAAIRRARDSR